MDLIRKLKISSIIKISFTETEIKINNLINEYLTNLVIFTHPNNDEDIYYILDGKCIMLFDIDDNILYINNELYMKLINIISINETEKIITHIVNIRYNINFKFIYVLASSYLKRINNLYNDV